MNPFVLERRELLDRILAVRKIETRSQFWRDLEDHVVRKGFLTPKQEIYLSRAEEKYRLRAPQVSPAYLQKIRGTIQSAPGFKHDIFLMEMLDKVLKGQYLEPKELDAIGGAVLFLQNLREAWLRGLREAARSNRKNEAVFSVLVDIGVRLKAGHDAAPTKDDIEVLNSMMGEHYFRNLVGMVRSQVRLACRVADRYVQARI